MALTVWWALFINELIVKVCGIKIPYIYNFNENFKILSFRKFIFLDVFVSSLNFPKTDNFNLPEKPIHKKANTCIERKVFYAGAFCNFPRYERIPDASFPQKKYIDYPPLFAFAERGGCFIVDVFFYM